MNAPCSIMFHYLAWFSSNILCEISGTTLVQAMVFPLSCAKPLPTPLLLRCCQLPKLHISLKSYLKFKRKPFCLGLNVLKKRGGRRIILTSDMTVSSVTGYAHCDIDKSATSSLSSWSECTVVVNQCRFWMWLWLPLAYNISNTYSFLISVAFLFIPSIYVSRKAIVNASWCVEEYENM